MPLSLSMPRALAAAVLLFFSTSAAPSVPETVFVATLRAPTGEAGAGGNFYRVDLGTGKSTLVGRIVVDGNRPVGLTAMDFHPQTKVLYAITDINDGKKPTLVTVDPRNAEARLVGRLSIPLTDIAFGPRGRLYGWTSNTAQLATVDLQTGKVSPIGAGREPAVGGAFAIDAQRQAWVATWRPPPMLDRVDLDDGTVKPGQKVSNLNDIAALRSMKASPQGGLLAAHTVRASSAKSAILRIDPATGVAMPVAQIPDDAEAIAVLPEDASGDWRRWALYALLAVTILVVGLSMRTRLRRR